MSRLKIETPCVKALGVELGRVIIEWFKTASYTEEEVEAQALAFLSSHDITSRNDKAAVLKQSALIVHSDKHFVTSNRPFQAIQNLRSKIIGDGETTKAGALALESAVAFTEEAADESKASGPIELTIPSRHPPHVELPLIKRPANFKNCPAACEIDESITHISIGDLHGNALKLIYILIQEGFLTLANDTDYKELYKIYSAPYYSSDLNKSKRNMARFKEIIDAAIPSNTKRALTLIGDVLCDRGSSDYLTLLVLSKVKQAGINISCLYGNHDANFLRALEEPAFTGVHRLGTVPKGEPGDQGNSLRNVKIQIDAGIFTEEEFRTLTETVYIPMVKLIDYTISKDKQHITLFMHAPAGLEVIEGLAARFEIEYDGASPEALARTIDAINSAFTLKLRAKGLTELEDDEMKVLRAEMLSNPGHYGPDSNLPLSCSLQRIAWQRTLEGVKTVPWATIVHGHNGQGYRASELHINLDTKFGQGLTGGYPHFVRHSSEMTAKEYQHEMESDTTTATAVKRKQPVKAPDDAVTSPAKAAVWVDSVDDVEDSDQLSAILLNFRDAPNGKSLQNKVLDKFESTLDKIIPTQLEWEKVKKCLIDDNAFRDDWECRWKSMRFFAARMAGRASKPITHIDGTMPASQSKAVSTTPAKRPDVKAVISCPPLKTAVVPSSAALSINEAYFSENGIFPQYLKERHETYWFRDLCSSYVAVLLGCCGYKTESALREEYIERLKAQYNSSPREMDAIIDEGLARFSPRSLVGEEYNKSLRSKLTAFKSALPRPTEEDDMSFPMK